MRITVVTIHPEMFDSALSAGVLGRGIEAGHLSVDFVNPRDFTSDKHRSVDDTPYGGGPGMVMKVEPLVAAIESVSSAVTRRILLSPSGRVLTSERARSLAAEQHIVFVCGRYEGIDDRVEQIAIDETVSVGDYVVSGGELPAMIVIDALSRFVPGVLGDAASSEDESHESGLIEYPQYTRPVSFRGRDVPEILSSGHHGRIAEWRRQRSIERTRERRPDLMWRVLARDLAPLAARTCVILAHHPVYNRVGEVVTSSVTNLDIHDIARSATTYGIGAYLPVSPVAHQREKIERIVSVWQGEIDQMGADNRGQALSTVEVSASVADALGAIEARFGAPPVVVATSARDSGEAPRLTAHELVLQMAEHSRPVCLLFGTGWGLAAEVLSRCDAILRPIRGYSDFNHLSVRSAVGITLDRLFGRRGGEFPPNP